jgi:hypothetical protein
LTRRRDYAEIAKGNPGVHQIVQSPVWTTWWWGMASVRYVNAFVQNTPVMFGTGHPTQFGVLLSEYQVNEYWDLRTSQLGLQRMRAYVVSLKQRLTIYNPTADDFAAASRNDYSGYPLLVVQKVRPDTDAQNLQYYLEDYAPKTLNAAVNTSQNQGTNSSQSSSVQHTVGSATSVTNTYETSVSAGFFGLDPTGSVTAGFSRSATTGAEKSQSKGRGEEHGVQSGTTSSMSIKDWGVYAFLDMDKQRPSWVWGQEYPWDVINFRSALGDGSENGEKVINLPQYVQALLCDGTNLFPPSHISQFGLNFVAHAKWLFYVAGDAGADDECVDFSHNLTYWTGMHSASGTAPNKVVTATIIPVAVDYPVEKLSLNLPELSLDPIRGAGPGNGAVVGFVKSEFIAPPSASGRFRLKSGANNLYITDGTGFACPSDEETVLTASGIAASFTLRFKVVDPDLQLSLHLKHWKTTSADCVLTLSVNGQKITRYVDAMNAGGGSDNITSVTLRNLDYTNPEFYDYLVMGVNTITIGIAPAVAGDPLGYALRALAVQ